ncbi:MAG: hypothetical protein WAJ93_15990 [Candidatus Nitrosopolaris sp.]
MSRKWMSWKIILDWIFSRTESDRRDIWRNWRYNIEHTLVFIRVDITG